MYISFYWKQVCPLDRITKTCFSISKPCLNINPHPTLFLLTRNFFCIFLFLWFFFLYFHFSIFFLDFYYICKIHSLNLGDAKWAIIQLPFFAKWCPTNRLDQFCTQTFFMMLCNKLTDVVKLECNAWLSRRLIWYADTWYTTTEMTYAIVEIRLNEMDEMKLNVM